MLFPEKYTKPWGIALFEANEISYHLYSYQSHTVLIKIQTTTSEKVLFEEGNLPHNVTVTERCHAGNCYTISGTQTNTVHAEREAGTQSTEHAGKN